MKLLLQLLRSSWLTGLSAAVLGAVSGVATLSLIAMIHQVLASPEANSAVHPLLFACTCGVVLLTQCGAKFLLVRLSQSTAARLRYELCTRILAAPLSQLESKGDHRLLAALNNDVNSITHSLTGLPDVCAGGVILLSGLIYLTVLSLPLTVACATMGLFATVSYFVALRYGERYLSRAREDQDEVARQTRDMIRGLRELKGNYRRCLDFVFAVLLPADTRMRGNLITGSSIQGFAHSWGRLCLFIGIGLLIFVSPRFWPNPPDVLTGFTLTILYLTYPLDGILGWLPSWNDARIAMRQIHRLGLDREVFESDQQDPVIPPFQTLELRNVTYEYVSPDGRNFRLGPISFSLAAGDELFIAGGNGSGKTTLAKLLTGLYVPQQGEILLNGQVVTDRSRNNFRQLFSTIFVEGHIFDRLLGADWDGARLRYWAELLGIESKVDLASGRFRTEELSRGQHKRLALLTACMDDCPILVFDEWAAEQDPTFKDVFYRKILPELRRLGKTSVAVTHDDRYFSVADRVLTLVDGQLTSTAKRVAA